MAKELVMPQMGYDMQQGTVVRWIKKEGDEVTRGEPVAEIETDKAVVEMESSGGGVLRKRRSGVEPAIWLTAARPGLETSIGEQVFDPK